jgi:hypothetical protein
MKKAISVLSILVLMGIILSGCDTVTNPSSSITGNISVGSTTSKGTRSLASESNLGNITEIRIRAFTENGELLPAVGVSDTEGAAILSTWDTENAKWKGSMTLDLTGYTEQLFFHAMAYYNGEIVFQGTSSLTSAFGNTSIPITSSTGYTAGDRGPGGGWIFYDKGVDGDGNSLFGNDGKMGKSWRYLEASAEDFSLAWTETADNNKIDLDNYGIASGKVKKKVDGVLTDDELFEYDWYWGPASTHNTNQGLLEGWLNTEILSSDDISSATPNLKQVKGRKAPAPADETTNTRRDLSKTLRGKIINNYFDWFVPSKAELLRIFSYIASGHTDRNFADDTNYWSSSENSGTTAYAIDFNSESDPGAEVTAERSEVYHVRPVRAF